MSYEAQIQTVALDILKSLYKTNPRWHADQLEKLEDTLVTKGRSPNDAKDFIKIVEDFTDVRLNTKIEAVFKEWSGKAWSVDEAVSQPTLSTAESASESASPVLTAAKRVSDALGMVFRVNPTPAESAMGSLNVFQVVTVNATDYQMPQVLDGANADRQEEKEETVLDDAARAIYQALVKTRNTGASVVLVDHITGTSPIIQNVFVAGVSQERLNKVGSALHIAASGVTGEVAASSPELTSRFKTVESEKPLAADMRAALAARRAEQPLPESSNERKASVSA